jgi:hypothetical protein
LDTRMQGCQYCPSGTYNAEPYTMNTQCTRCPAGTYQPATGATAPCLPLPANSIAIASASAYQCNGGYYRLTTTICAQCSRLSLNMTYVSSVTFMADSCTIQRFSCTPGYYRSGSAAPAESMACVACDYATAPDESTTVAMIARCQTECCERGIACRVEGSCAPGYYEQSAAICASYDVKTCVRCAPVVCDSTALFPMINTPCTSPQKTDTCTAACDGANMIRINATQCDCVPGFIHNGIQCSKCPPGTFQHHRSCVACRIDTYLRQLSVAVRAHLPPWTGVVL